MIWWGNPDSESLNECHIEVEQGALNIELSCEIVQNLWKSGKEGANIQIIFTMNVWNVLNDLMGNSDSESLNSTTSHQIVELWILTSDFWL